MTHDPDVVLLVIDFIKRLIQADPVFGQLFVGYYKQILPSLNYFLVIKPQAQLRDPQKKKQIGKSPVSILAEVKTQISELLDLFERTGGKVDTSHPGSLSLHQVHDPHL